MFCAQCGAPLPDGAKFCPTCGAAMPTPSGSSAPLPPPVAGSGEEYLGGLTSPNLHLKGRGVSSLGYGVYATDRRIIGVNSKRGLVAGLQPSEA